MSFSSWFQTIYMLQLMFFQRLHLFVCCRILQSFDFVISIYYFPLFTFSLHLNYNYYFFAEFSSWFQSLYLQNPEYYIFKPFQRFHFFFIFKKCNKHCMICPFQEFNLIDRKELAPLQDLIERLTTKDR